MKLVIVMKYEIDKIVYCLTPQPTMPQRVVIFLPNLKNNTANTFFYGVSDSDIETIPNSLKDKETTPNVFIQKRQQF